MSRRVRGSGTANAGTFTVRRVDERSWADLVTLTLDNGELIMLTVEEYADSRAAIAQTLGIAPAAVDVPGMTLQFGERGLLVPAGTA